MTKIAWLTVHARSVAGGEGAIRKLRHGYIDTPCHYVILEKESVSRRAPMLRIAFYLGHYPSPGGTMMGVRGLAHGMSHDGHQVKILAHGREESCSREEGVELRTFRRPPGGLPFRVSPRLLDYLRTNQDALDVIVLNGAFHPDLPPLARAARKRGLPYVVSPFDPFNPAFFAKPALRKRLYWRLFERPMLNRALAVQVLADAHSKYLERLGIKRPAFTVPNGYGVDSTDLKPIRVVGDGPITFGYMGRIDAWHKGLDILLEGFGIARNRFPDIRLVLQGADWGDEQELKRLAHRLGLSEVVTFKGRSWDSSVDVVSCWDVFLTASRFDGFLFTVIEAMLAGRPVICSAEAGSAEHVERSGCGVVITPTPEGVASGIARILDRRIEWPAMGALGRAYALEQLNWDRIASRAAFTYGMLLHDQAGRRAETRE